MLHVIKGKHLQSRLLYPLWISFRFKGEIKNFTDNQKLREFSGTESALQKTLKKLLQTGNIRERKGLHNQIQNNNVNGKRIMCINNFLKSKWLNAPIKRHKLAEWIQKKKKKTLNMHPRETHLRPRDTYRLKVRGWKIISHAKGNQTKWEQ